MTPLTTTERATGHLAREPDDTVAIAAFSNRQPTRRVPWEAIAVAVLLALAFLVRLPGLDTPSIEQRENQSSLLARGWFLHGGDVAAWQQRVLDEVHSVLRPYEPPLLELAASAFYRATAGERIWFPRLLSTLAWLAGAVALALLAARMTNTAGMLTAVGLYVVWPYAFSQSRKFMPDSLLVACIVAATLLIVRYWERPTRARLALAATVSAFATLVKPGVGLFFVVAVFVALALAHGRLRAEVTSWRLPAFAVVAAAPAVLYYLVGQATEFTHPDAGSGRTTPQDVLTSEFWTGWWEMVSFLLRAPQSQAALAILPLAVGVVGLLLVPRGIPRATLWGLTCGYVFFALAVARYTATHPYYALPLIPILALAIGVVVGRLDERLSRAPTGRVALAVVVAGVVGAGAYKAIANIAATDAPTQTIADYRRIGVVTDHTTRAIVINPSLSHPVMYWGWIVGQSWDVSTYDELPSTIDPREKDYLVLYGNETLGVSPGLRAFVRGEPIVAETDRFTVFALCREGAVTSPQCAGRRSPSR